MDLPLASPPSHPPRFRSGTRARGAAYENRVGLWLARQAVELGWLLHNHPWLACGNRVCQPDFLLVSPSNCIILVEVKLIQCDCSGQIAKYKQALAGFSVTSLQIVRRLVSPSTVDSLESTIDGGVMLLWA